ncbi:hypothetical protein SAMN04487948_10124 [Halogranum amylolyticum]|uniref:Uncharacterized protein n=1 Tax=Halogranum amylolyticum TaxID=660520 RepID=A0A1H8MQM5_9EURY|nr:hypothetical protein SAMN04487948_10124 [Halogranum amylolyticum]
MTTNIVVDDLFGYAKNTLKTYVSLCTDNTQVSFTCLIATADDDILLGINGEVSSRWGYRLPTHGGNLRVRALLVGN